MKLKKTNNLMTEAVMFYKDIGWYYYPTMELLNIVYKVLDSAITEMKLEEAEQAYKDKYLEHYVNQYVQNAYDCEVFNQWTVMENYQTPQEANLNKALDDFGCDISMLAFRLILKEVKQND